MYKIRGEELEEFLVKEEEKQSIIYKTEQVKIIYNQLESNDNLALYNNQYQTKETIDIFGKGDDSLLEMQFNLSQHPIFFRNKKQKNLTTPAMSGNIVFLNQDENQANIIFEKDKDYSTFDIHLSKKQLEKYEGYSEKLDHFLTKINSDESSQLLDDAISINANILNIMTEIKSCTFEGLSRKIFFDAKSFELLAELIHLGDNEQGIHKLSSSAIEKMKYAAFLIESNIDKPLTIIEISKIIGINQTKLKTQFKQVFNLTIFEFLQKIRMKQAKIYLADTNLSVQEIGILVGYKNTSNFSIAFKNTYGYSPIIFRSKL